MVRTKPNDQRESEHMQAWMRAVLVVFIVILSAPVSAQYRYYESDYPTTSNGNVGVYKWPNGEARAEIRWYNDTQWNGLTYMKGIFFNTYIVGNGKGGGCIFVRVIWETLDVGFGFPPSVSGSLKQHTAGYWYSCRPNPNAAIPYIKLGGANWNEGVTFTSRALMHVVLEVCQGFSVNGPKINCTADRMSYGGQ